MKLIVALFALTTPALAQTLPEGSMVQTVLDAALTECRAADPSTPASLDIQPAAITWTDLDGDGDRDDAVVDFNDIYCSTGALWNGTGGAPVHALIDAAAPGPNHVWTGWGWQVIRHGDTPLLLISQHGTWCGGTGSDPCVRAISFADGRALTPGPTND